MSPLRYDEPEISLERIARAKKTTGYTDAELREVLLVAASVIELARLHGVVADPGGDSAVGLLETLAEDTEPKGWLQKAANELTLSPLDSKEITEAHVRYVAAMADTERDLRRIDVAPHTGYKPASFPVEFRVLDSVERGVAPTIPWRLVEPLRDKALRGHNQTLERLNERGGLSLAELYCHVHDVPFNNWFRWSHKERRADSLAWFKKWSAT